MNASFKWIVGLLLALGLVTLFLPDKRTPSIDSLGLSFNEYDEIIQTPVSKINAVELAVYLMKQEHHYNLIDLQGTEATYTIPTAESFTVNEFLSKKIPVNETIILYSEYETTAIQLYYLLMVRGYFNVKVLAGGKDQWSQQILQPALHSIASDQQVLRKQLTEFFGGSISELRTEVVPKLIQLKKKVKAHQGC